MMENINIDLVLMSDANIVTEIGQFIKQKRLEQNKTQAELSAEAGLNRYTLGKIEKGESITLLTLIQLLRALDALYILNAFTEKEEISPLAYAKLKKNKKQRASGNKTIDKNNQSDLGW